MNEKAPIERAERPNKSQLKRDLEQVKIKAKQLLQLKPKQLDTLDLESALLDALDEMKRIKSANAQNRHLQFITKLLAGHDNLEDIDAQLESFLNPHLHFQKIDKQVEQCMQSLFSGDQNTLDQLLQNPKLENRQQFMQALRNAQKEQKNKTNKEPLAPESKQTKRFKSLLRDLLK